MLTTFQGLIALLAAVDALSHVDGLGDLSKQVLARCSMDFFSFSFQFLVCWVREILFSMKWFSCNLTNSSFNVVLILFFQLPQFFRLTWFFVGSSPIRSMLFAPNSISLGLSCHTRT